MLGRFSTLGGSPRWWWGLRRVRRGLGRVALLLGGGLRFGEVGVSGVGAAIVRGWRKGPTPVRGGCDSRTGRALCSRRGA